MQVRSKLAELYWQAGGKSLVHLTPRFRSPRQMVAVSCQLSAVSTTGLLARTYEGLKLGVRHHLLLQLRLLLHQVSQVPQACAHIDLVELLTCALLGSQLQLATLGFQGRTQEVWPEQHVC